MPEFPTRDHLSRCTRYMPHAVSASGPLNVLKLPPMLQAKKKKALPLSPGHELQSERGQAPPQLRRVIPSYLMQEISSQMRATQDSLFYGNIFKTSYYEDLKPCFCAREHQQNQK
jgi:hypothetical protein